MAKDYYTEIDKALKSYEEGMVSHRLTVTWCADRICWCWKFRKINEEQMSELTDRATKLFELGYM